MSLLKTLELKSFRGMSNLVFGEMTPVTVLVGANNAGKTSVLEAAALALRAPDPGQWVQVARNRDMDMSMVDGLWSLFPGGKAIRLDDGPQQTGKLNIEAVFANARDHKRTLVASCIASESWDEEEASEAILRVELKIDENPFSTMEFRRRRLADWAEGKVFKGFTVTPATHRFTKTLVEHLSNVIDDGKKQLAVDMLQLFDADVEDLDVVSSLGRESVRVTHKQRGVVDLSSFGDGMRRATVLLLALARAAEGALLVDEIESGIHPTVLPDILTRLMKAAEVSKTQLIVATHSLEAVDALIAAAESNKSEDALSAFWLKRRDGGHEVRRYDYAKLCVLREQGMDIR